MYFNQRQSWINHEIISSYLNLDKKVTSWVCFRFFFFPSTFQGLHFQRSPWQDRHTCPRWSFRRIEWCKDDWGLAWVWLLGRRRLWTGSRCGFSRRLGQKVPSWCSVFGRVRTRLDRLYRMSLVRFFWWLCRQGVFGRGCWKGDDFSLGRCCSCGLTRIKMRQ